MKILRYFVYISISVVPQDKDSEWQVKPCCTENVMFMPMSRKSEEMRWYSKVGASDEHSLW